MLIGKGTFEGLNGHKMTGDFTLEQTNEGILMRSDPFYFDGAAPGPAWALGKSNGQLIKGTVFLELTPHTEVNEPQEILITIPIERPEVEAIITWCTIHDVPLGVGTIEWL